MSRDEPFTLMLSMLLTCFHVCKQVNETILKSIVSFPNLDYFYATNFSQLTESLDRIVSSSCRAVVDQCTTPLAPTTTTREPTLSYIRFILVIGWLSCYGILARIEVVVCLFVVAAIPTSTTTKTSGCVPSSSGNVTGMLYVESELAEFVHFKRRPSISCDRSCQIYLVFFVECKLDIAFLVDCSGSIRDTNPPNGPDNWGLVIEFMVNIVMGLTIGPDQTHVAAVTFGKTILLHCYLSPPRFVNLGDYERLEDPMISK